MIQNTLYPKLTLLFIILLILWIKVCVIEQFNYKPGFPSKGDIINWSPPPNNAPKHPNQSYVEYYRLKYLCHEIDNE